MQAQRVLAITSSPNWRRPSSAAENDPWPPEWPAVHVTPISARLTDAVEELLRRARRVARGHAHREDVDVGERAAVRLEALTEVADHRRELLVVADHRGARGARQRLAATEERRPAVPPTGHAVEHDLGVPAEPEPWVRLRHRPRA